MKSIHLTRAGRHTSNQGAAVTFSDTDLRAIAAAYDPRTHEAPIVVGHPKTDAPAYGWVKKLEARPDGLYALPRQGNPEFSEIVRSGAYKKVSPAFYPPSSKSNPKPGRYYLRHVGFLGAEPPAVKGLNAIQFSEAEDLFFMEEDMLSLREHRLDMREREWKRQKDAETINRICREGRFPIGLVPGAVAFCESLSDQDEISFSEGAETRTHAQSQWFLDFLSKLPMQAIEGELCKAEFSEGDDDMTLPEGYTADPYMTEVHAFAYQHMKKHGGTYFEAVREAERNVPKR
ncbi:hypothetical protein [Ensifer soli]|uniref:hypothetical protein n=1 Tax=Ciceribacter sp. sgz301302 TaxID=3342379 RepID=UPI0035B92A09